MSQETTEGENTPTVEAEVSGSDQSDDLSKDTMFELLKNQRRRDALHYLAESDGESTLSDLAEQIAAKENDIERRALSSDQRKRVYIGLYQCHLPKLADAGVVEFDKHRGDVELRDPVTQLEPYLDERSDETGEENEDGADDTGSAGNKASGADADERADADVNADVDDPGEAEADDAEAGDTESNDTESDDADRVPVSVTDDGSRQPSTGTLPAAFEEPEHEKPPTADLVTAGVGAAAAAGILGLPGFRRVPRDLWILVGLAVVAVAAVRNPTPLR